MNNEQIKARAARANFLLTISAGLIMTAVALAYWWLGGFSHFEVGWAGVALMLGLLVAGGALFWAAWRMLGRLK